MKAVFIFSSANNTEFRIVEAFEHRGGYSHNEGLLMDGFSSFSQARKYCNSNNFNIVFGHDKHSIEEINETLQT